MKCKLVYFSPFPFKRCTITFSQSLTLVDPDKLKKHFGEEMMRDFLIHPKKCFRLKESFGKFKNLLDIWGEFYLKVTIRLPLITKRLRILDIMRSIILEGNEVRVYPVPDKRETPINYFLPGTVLKDIENHNDLFVSTEEEIMAEFLDYNFLYKVIMNISSTMIIGKSLEPLFYTLLIAGKIKLPWE